MTTSDIVALQTVSLVVVSLCFSVHETVISRKISVFHVFHYNMIDFTMKKVGSPYYKTNRV